VGDAARDNKVASHRCAVAEEAERADETRGGVNGSGAGRRRVASRCAIDHDHRSSCCEHCACSWRTLNEALSMDRR
jgi:hypothetical protein